MGHELKKGDVFGVNVNSATVGGKSVFNHLIVFVEDSFFFDIVDGSVYMIKTDDVISAMNVPSVVSGRMYLDFVETLPERVYTVVAANARVKYGAAEKLEIFKPI